MAKLRIAFAAISYALTLSFSPTSMFRIWSTTSISGLCFSIRPSISNKVPGDSSAQIKLSHPSFSANPCALLKFLRTVYLSLQVKLTKKRSTRSDTGSSLHTYKTLRLCSIKPRIMFSTKNVLPISVGANKTI